MSHDWEIPNYTVRINKRAKRVSIKVSSWAGLEVVVPVKLKRSEIQQMLRSKSDWIKKSIEKSGHMEELRNPEGVHFNLIKEAWTTSYARSNASQITVTQNTGSSLVMTGPVNDSLMVAKALNKWVQNRATDVLIPWLHQISAELSIPFNRVSVRRQRTKWGSCSAEKSISLNRNLLFLDESSARYVLVHELCHTRKLDHSNEFWNLLETLEPNARETSVSVKKASQLVPKWAMV